MKKVKKSNLLLSIEKIIEHYEIKTISLTKEQYKSLCNELYPFGNVDKLKDSKFIYKNRTIKIWDIHE
jgi:hypothetical protein